MPVSYDKRNKAWRFRFRRTVSGQLVRASKLLPQDWTRAQAEAFDRAESSRLYGVASGVIKDDPRIENAIQLYLESHGHLRNFKGCAANLAILYPYYAGRGFSDLSAIASEYSRAPGLSPATIRNRLAYLRSACRWAWKHCGMGDADPGSRMALPSVSNERQTYITAIQVERLAKECEYADTQSVVRLAFYTGLRWIAELYPRQPEDVIRAKGTAWLKVGITKNGQPRMVPIHPKAVASLKSIPFQVPTRTIYGDFQRAAKRMGLDGVRMHDLRHSLASAIVSNGGTLPEVQAALGHVSVVSSKRYSHMYPESLKTVLFGVGKMRQNIGHKAAKKTA